MQAPAGYRHERRGLTRPAGNRVQTHPVQGVVCETQRGVAQLVALHGHPGSAREHEIHLGRGRRRGFVEDGSQASVGGAPRSEDFEGRAPRATRAADRLGARCTAKDAIYWRRCTPTLDRPKHVVLRPAPPVGEFGESPVLWRIRALLATSRHATGVSRRGVAACETPTGDAGTLRGSRATVRGREPTRGPSGGPPTRAAREG